VFTAESGDFLLVTFFVTFKFRMFHKLHFQGAWGKEQGAREMLNK
jgi:hypothetical protein